MGIENAYPEYPPRDSNPSQLCGSRPPFPHCTASPACALSNDLGPLDVHADSQLCFFCRQPVSEIEFARSACRRTIGT